jgi:putative DNA primase/helicase
VEATPAFFTLNATDFDLDLNAPRPATWLGFLDALWGDDQQSIDTLQELFGYLLTNDTRQQKIFLLVGPKRSGKGTIARVLTSIVGKANVAAPTLAGLSTNFGMWPLIGKSVAIVSDARLSGRTDQVAVVERLLTISGEDSITIDRKNMEPSTCRLSSRFVILTNELPRLSDASGAVVSRMILLQMSKSFFGREDHDLTEKLLAERQGILLWAIEGWCRLRERGRFIQPDSAFESLADMDDLASPIKAFVRDCCVIGPTESVSVDDLFDAWERWCVRERREKYVGNRQTFGRDLLAAVPGLVRKRPRDGNERVRIYEGIGLSAGA